jgi:arylsulfatase A-like enzyme
MRAPRWIWLLLLLTLIRPATSRRDVRAERYSSDPPPGPNLLILIGDDHAGGTLGIDGDPRRATPSLDRLARQGVRFDRAFCNSPLCTASRQSLITGRLPHAVGVTRLATPLPDDALTLGDWLGDLGYLTAAIGKMHFNGPSRHGFEGRVDTPDWERHLEEHPPEGGDQRRRWRPFKDPAAAWLNAECQDAGLPASAMESTFYADCAAKFFRNHKRVPFALVIGFHEPHAPFPFPREWRGRYSPDDFSVPPVSEEDRARQPRVFSSLTPEDMKGIQASYYTSLSWVDHQIGRVLDALDAEGLAENTIVVYCGDNGYLLGRRGRFEKHVLYEPGVRVPLIVRWTGHLPEDRRVTEMAELVDLFPTLMDLAGLPRPPELHGQSLAPLMKGDPGAEGRSHVFSEYLDNEEAMVRSGRYKLIVGTGRRHGDGYAPRHVSTEPYERLYDLESDPDETADLSGHPEHQPVAADLRRRLHERLVTTREGKAPVPPDLSGIEAIRWCLVPRDSRDGTDH